MKQTKFSEFDDLIPDQGEFAVIINHNSNNGATHIEAFTQIPFSSISSPVSHIYLSACNLFDSNCTTIHTPNIDAAPDIQKSHERLKTISTYLLMKKKHKPVAKKIHSAIAELPEKFHIIQKITGDPLADLLVLNPDPPPFVPCGRYTEERKEKMDKVHPPGFMWPAERALLHDFICKHEHGFAWDNTERGHFRTDFFPPVDFPLLPHTP